MTDDMNFTWACIEGNLDEILGYGEIPWELFGFSIPLIRWASQHGYQVSNKYGTMVSFFPIENMEAFEVSLGPLFHSDNPKYKIIDQETCDRLHSELLLLSAEKNIELLSTPSEEDVYKSQVLLLLTKMQMSLSNIESRMESDNV